MSMLYVLIPLALVLLAVAAWALIWAIRSGQFDDLESHGWSVVLDDDQRPPPDPEAEPRVGADIVRDRESESSGEDPT
jgi:cbb3-type cytochrome oxidase maturation protein